MWKRVSHQQSTSTWLFRRVYLTSETILLLITIYCVQLIVTRFKFLFGSSAQGLGLPFLNAYLDSVATNFSHGANFATAGSTIQRQNTTLFQTGYSPFSLDVQSWQYAQFKSRSQIAYKKGKYQRYTFSSTKWSPCDDVQTCQLIFGCSLQESSKMNYLQRTTSLRLCTPSTSAKMTSLQAMSVTWLLMKLKQPFQISSTNSLLL